MSFARFSQIQTMQEGDRFFIKFFLIDDSLNLNQWKVTADAVRSYLRTFIGTPFVITRRADHPTPENQEAERDGTITEVGFDDKSGRAFGIAEMHQSEAIEQIKSGEISFVSPSISVEAGDFQMINGREIATKFRGEHVAGVKEPAFGKVKAQIKGQCSGSESQCSVQLHRVQASLDILEANKQNIKLFNLEALKNFLRASPCMESCLKSKEGPIGDQEIAICINECGESGSSGNQQFDLINSSINILNSSNSMNYQKYRSSQEGCPEGQHKNEAGECVTNAEGCPEGQHMNPEGTCVQNSNGCPEGQHANPEGVCVQNSQEGCPEGQHKSESGTCVENAEGTCPEGQSKDENGNCVESARLSPCAESKLKDYGSKIANLETQNRELRARVDREIKKPVIDRIIAAKIQLGVIAETETNVISESLFRKDASYLAEIAKEYENLAASRKQSENQPYIRYRTASLQRSNNNDEIVQNYQRLIN